MPVGWGVAVHERERVGEGGESKFVLEGDGVHRRDEEEEEGGTGVEHVRQNTRRKRRSSVVPLRLLGLFVGHLSAPSLLLCVPLVPLYRSRSKSSSLRSQLPHHLVSAPRDHTHCRIILAYSTLLAIPPANYRQPIPSPSVHSSLHPSS